MLWLLTLVATILFVATGWVSAAALCITLFTWAALREYA